MTYQYEVAIQNKSCRRLQINYIYKFGFITNNNVLKLNLIEFKKIFNQNSNINNLYYTM